MKEIFVQANRRSGLAVMLVGVMLAITAAPSLAWADKGGPDFQAARGESIVSVNHTRTVYDSRETGVDAIQFETSEFPWALARAE